MASDPPIEIALSALLVIVVLTAILLAYAVGLRLAHVLHERQMQRLRKRWWPVLARAAALGPNLEPVAAPGAYRVSRIPLLREFCRFWTLVKDDGAAGLELLARSLDLDRVARKLLRQRSLSNRLIAIKALGCLRDADSWDSLFRFMYAPGVTVSITAAEALVRIDAERAIGDVIERIGKCRNWPKTQVGRILNIAGPSLVSRPICAAISSADSETAIRLLRFHESAYVGAMDSLVARLLLTRSDPALIAAALKAIRGHLPTVLGERLARHDAWYVRMQAARLLGRFGRREDYRILEPMLSDPEWWVRYRAAQAIAQLPFMGPNALRKLRDRQDDLFARDILQHAFAEAGVV